MKPGLVPILLLPLVFILLQSAAAQTLAPLPELPDLAPSGPAYPQQSLEPAGGIADERIGTLEEGRRLQDALREMIVAFESGNAARLEGHLDASMIGYQHFVEGARRDMSRLTQVRIQLIDTQVVVGPDVGVVTTRFEKRFVNAIDARPGVVTGQTQLLFHRNGKSWNVAGMTGDNPFSGNAGSLAQMTFNPGALAYSGTFTTILRIVEPDAAGLPALQVTVTTTSGDRESFSVPAIQPGVFSRPLTVAPTLPTPGDGVLQESTLPFGDIVVRYTDASPGGNRPPVPVTRRIRIQ